MSGEELYKEMKEITGTGVYEEKKVESKKILSKTCKIIRGRIWENWLITRRPW